MNKKLTLLGIVLLIGMTLTNCFYYHRHNCHHRDYDHHWQGDNGGHHDRGPHGGDYRPR
jgi:hypothetical protein